MKNNSIYLKYKQERENARQLKDVKNHNWLVDDIPQATEKSLAKQSLRVSLPIQHFINVQNQKHMLLNNSVFISTEVYNKTKDTSKFKIPRILITRMDVSTSSKINTEKLRQVRRIRANETVNKVPDATLNKNMNESPSVILTKETPPEIIVTAEKIKENKQKKISSTKADTAKGNSQQAENFVSPAINISVIPVKDTNGITCKVVTSLAEAKRAMKISEESKFTQTEAVQIITKDEFEILNKVQKSGILVKDLSEALDNSLRKKELKKANVNEIIDLEEIEDKEEIKDESLTMALNHSKCNKNFLQAVMDQIKNSTCGQVIEASRPTRPGTPFPYINSTSTDVCTYTTAPVNTLIPAPNPIPASIPLPATIPNSHAKRLKYLSQLEDMTLHTNKKKRQSETQAHDEKNNKMRNINQANDQLSETNMNILADIAETHKKLHQPPVATALMRLYQIQRHQQAQKQKAKLQELQSQQQILPTPQLTPTQLSTPAVPPSPLQPAQLQPPHPQQSETKPLTLQPSQLQPPTLQPSQLQPPTLQPTQLQPPTLQPSQLQPPTLQRSQLVPTQKPQQLQRQKQLEQQMNRQMYYRQQQWQQNAKYTLTRNNYTDIHGQHVNSTMNTQQGNIQLYPGDPRRRSVQFSDQSRIRPGRTSTISTYEANFQSAQNIQNNNWNYGKYGTNPNHYW